MSPQAAHKMSPPEEETPEKRALRVSRIKNLIQQASSPHGDGVVAATRACALIRKFGLDIVDPELVTGLHRQLHEARELLRLAQTGIREDEDIFDPSPVSPFTTTPASPFYQQGGRVPPTQQHQTIHTQHMRQPVPPGPPGPYGPMTHPVTISASKFAGKCKQCGKLYDIGDSVLWMKNIGCWCVRTSCYADYMAIQNGASVVPPGGNPFGP